MRKYRHGVTLIELVVVLITLAILASIGFVTYDKVRENALNKEAVTTLKLIQAAEKIYYNENNFYYPNSGTAATTEINANLGLSAPLDSPIWTYTVDSAATAAATRSGAAARVWTLSIGSETPTCSGSGC